MKLVENMKSKKLFVLLFIVISILSISCDKLTEPNESYSWVLQKNKTDDITYYSIFFADKNNGWICGYNGTIKNSKDGGITWQSQQSGVSKNLWDISFINSQKGWISGANTILETSDGGNSWIDISPSDKKTSIYVEIKFIDENNGWTSTNTGEILKTANGGISWEIKKSGNIGGSRLSVIDEQTVYAFSGELYKTINGGNTWDTLNTSIPKNYMVSEMLFINSNNGWIVTENGTGGTIINEFPVLITHDGGKTWVSSELIKDGGVRCIYFINEKIGWIAGIKNVYKTANGGMNWVLEYTSENYTLQAKDISFIDENNGWIINWSGEIYNYQKIFN